MNTYTAMKKEYCSP